MRGRKSPATLATIRRKVKTNPDSHVFLTLGVGYMHLFEFWLVRFIACLSSDWPASGKNPLWWNSLALPGWSICFCFSYDFFANWKSKLRKNGTLAVMYFYFFIFAIFRCLPTHKKPESKLVFIELFWILFNNIYLGVPTFYPLFL